MTTKFGTVYLVIHSATGSVGSTREWLSDNSLVYQVIDASSIRHWPDIYRGDRIILFGGDMQVWESQENRWLFQEKKFIVGAIKKEIPVFGICFGAQLLAEALGAKIYDADDWEIDGIRST